MRNTLSWATIVASLLVSFPFVSSAQAQGQPSPSAHASRYGFGVVDISYIFKNHQRFKAMMEGMKKEVQATEAALRQERDQIAQMEEVLKQYKPGTPPYKAQDEKITEAKAQFNLKATKQRKEFLEREAKIYYQAYLEVNDAVKFYAQRNNLGLVLRFNGDPIDPNNRADVLRAINKPVVYQNGIDITPDILRTINRGGDEAFRPQGPGAGIPKR